MSIKTLRKRIALVAVSALGAGLLSITPANAGAIVLANLSISDVGSTSGVCATGTPTAPATARVIVVGGKQDFAIATNSDGYAVITGGAKWVAGGASDTISSSLKLMNFNETGTKTIEITSAGPLNVAFYNDSATEVETWYLQAVTSCGNSYNAGTSYAQINNASGDSAVSNIDTVSETIIAYDTSGVQKVWLDIDLNDSYLQAVDTSADALIATATGGCTVNFTNSATSGTATAVATGAGNDTNDIVILGDNTPRTCRVTMTLGSVTVADKTVYMRGDAASIAISAADSSVYWGAVDGSDDADSIDVNKNALVYVIKDSAGNVINHNATPTLANTTGGFSQCSLAAGSYPVSAMTTYGIATVDAVCQQVNTYGAGKVGLKISRQSDGVTLYSNVIDATMSKGLYTFEAAWDKASYNVGDIMTLTITGKDSGGRLVRDSELLAGVEVTVAGATALSSVTEADYFVNGVKKYKFSANTTAAQYAWTVALDSGSDMDALTGTYTITNPSSGVSNAEVLAAIVKLIASINKQIAKLQKLIKK